jgi:two-component system cell cycle response regulator
MGEKLKRVLLVEDDLDTVSIVRECLSQASFNVAHAGTLSDALERLGGEPFDAIVLDLCLPDSRGPDTFRKVEGKFPNIPVVVLTGAYDESLGVKALQQGAQDFLLKTQFDAHLLRRAITYAIERQRLRSDLVNLSLRDPLTNLYNRRGLSALAEHQLTLAVRDGRIVVVVSVDLDRFKKINDAYGHEEGDRALVLVAEVLRKTFRAPDVLARVGGDEFIVVATTPHVETAATVGTRLRAQLNAATAAAGVRYQLSASVGVSTFVPLVTTTVDELFAAADRAMYADKRSRRSRRLRRVEGHVARRAGPGGGGKGPEGEPL